jgi:hydroxymethylpyrimidine pyrophosphatase-like HAD family hydrolase
LMTRLLVLDIDGTLLDPSDIVTPTVRDAITRARAQGVQVVFATGRRLSSTHPIVAELGIDLPLVLYNGSLVWSTEEHAPLHEAPFSPETLAAIVERTHAAMLDPVLQQGPTRDTEERVVIGDAHPKTVAGDRAILPPWFADDLVAQVPCAALPLTPHVMKVTVFGPEPAVRAVTSELGELGIATYHFGPSTWGSGPPSWAGMLHMPGASKARAVALLAADLGITMADVVAVGDGDNDLELLEAAGIGVAMGNAPAFVRARADEVVRGHDEDGVAEAIERFVLNGRRGELLGGSHP